MGYLLTHLSYLYRQYFLGYLLIHLAHLYQQYCMGYLAPACSLTLYTSTAGVPAHTDERTQAHSAQPFLVVTDKREILFLFENSIYVGQISRK